jgi:hypothetical protein
MVLLASAFDQSRFFKAEDFELDEEKKLKIKKGTEELIGVGADQKKMLTIWFTNSEKGLPLNRTNNRVLRAAFGDPVDGWVGKIFILYRTEAEFRGRMVPALRVRIPPSKQATAGNGQPIAPKPAPAAEQLDTFSKPSLEEDLDDEILF